MNTLIVVTCGHCEKELIQEVDSHYCERCGMTLCSRHSDDGLCPTCAADADRRAQGCEEARTAAYTWDRF
jgi:exosome complex RNA-binding protein Csl4